MKIFGCIIKSFIYALTDFLTESLRAEHFLHTTIWNITQSFFYVVYSSLYTYVNFLIFFLISTLTYHSEMNLVTSIGSLFSIDLFAVNLKSYYSVVKYDRQLCQSLLSHSFVGRRTSWKKRWSLSTTSMSLENFSFYYTSLYLHYWALVWKILHFLLGSLFINQIDSLKFIFKYSYSEFTGFFFGENWG